MATKLPSRVQLVVGTTDFSQDEDLELVSSDSTPGGYDSLSFQLCDWKNRLPALATRVWLYDKVLSKTIWLGRVEEVSPITSGSPVRIGCRGYGFVGTTDRRLIGTKSTGSVHGSLGVPGPVVYTAGMTIEQVIANALSFCNDISDAGIVGGLLQLHEDSSNYALHTPLDVLNFATALTSGFSTPLLWWVRETVTSPVIAGLVTAFMDTSARYEIALEHNDKEYIESQYNLQGIINKTLVGWGHDQYEIQPPANTPVDYSQISIQRDKAVNASNSIRGVADAQSLANNYLGRFNVFRALNDTITICHSQAVAKPPLFSVPTSVPAYMIRSGHGIYVSNMPDGLGRYNIGLKYIVRSETNWSSGVTTLQGGELVNLDATIELIQSYQVNRLYNGTILSAASYPLVDQDTAPVYGPDFSGVTPSNFSSGIPVFVLDKNGLPYQAVVHPDLIADEGIEANFVVGDIGTIGFKGAIRVIPGKFDECEVLLGNAAGLITGADNVKLRFHKLPHDSSVMQFLFEVTVPGPRVTGHQIAPPAVLGKKEWIVPEVTVAATRATWAAMSLHAKKQFPGLPL